MVAQVITILLDDMDGSEATGTFEFAFDGSQYEIDLNDAHAKELREALMPFVENGRRVGGRKKKKAPTAVPEAASAPSAAEIREWARANGYEVTDRGRVPQEMRDAYNEAH